MLSATVVSEVAVKVAASEWRGRRQIVETEAQRLGCSANTLYTALRAVRGRTRKQRADRGHCRRLSADHVRAVAEVKAKGRDTLHDRIIATDDAIRAAEESGIVPKGSVTRSAFDRHAARGRWFGGHDRVYCRFQARRSNQLHQVDSSQSKYLRVIEKRDGEWIVGTRVPEYSRKRSEEPLGLWCTEVIDDHSRIVRRSYDVAPGESFSVVVEAIKGAWSADPRCALRGMPESLLCDHGPFRRSQEGRNFCESLGVDLIERMPNSPWVSGKVERQWRVFIQRFEAPFLLKPEMTLTLTELNRMLHSFDAETNAKAHPFFMDRSRVQVYADGMDMEQVRYLPEDLGDAIYREDYRTVKPDSTMRLANRWYSVPDELAGRKVRIVFNAEGTVLVEYDGKQYPAKLFVPHDAGEYRAHAFTAAQWLAKDAKARTVDRIPREGADAGEENVLSLHVGEKAAVSSPFAAMEREEYFTNKEEALRALEGWIGKPIHTWDPKTHELLLTLLDRHEMLRRDVLRDFAGELRAQMAQVS